MYSERPEGLKYLLGLSFEDRGLVSEVGWWLVGSWRMEVDCAPIKGGFARPWKPLNFSPSACLPQVTHGKPAPDLFLAAAGLLGVPPESCVAIEDAASGAEVSLRGRIRGRRAAKVGELV